MKLYRNPPTKPAADAAPSAATADAPKKRGKKAGPETASQATEADASVGEMVTIIKTANAAKLSPRGDGELTYQVGRMGDAVLVRIQSNPSAGRFSREWVGVDAVRKALAELPKESPMFKGALALKSAWKGLSACNPGFGAAIFKAEGVFVANAEKKGLMSLASATVLDEWERAMLDIKVPKSAQQVPLNPPKTQPFFKKRGGEEAPTVPNADAGETTTTGSEVEPVEQVEPATEAEPLE